MLTLRKYIRQKSLDYLDKMVYNKYIVHGLVMVSTGILRYDKRGGLSNPDNCSNFKLNDNNTVAMAA